MSLQWNNIHVHVKNLKAELSVSMTPESSTLLTGEHQL